MDSLEKTDLILKASRRKATQEFPPDENRDAMSQYHLQECAGHSRLAQILAWLTSTSRDEREHAKKIIRNMVKDELEHKE